MVNVDIRTRVELKNETQRQKAQRGTAGKVALIGAFPSNKQQVFAAESFAQIVNHYGVKLNSKSEYWYKGVRAAKRIFMEGINGYAGASSITCVNICKLKPKFDDETIAPLYQETYSEDGLGYDPTTGQITTNDVTINSTDKFTITDETIKEDTTLTFEKLDKALKQIADEDMDLLFIANDLWEIMDNPMGVSTDFKEDNAPFLYKEGVPFVYNSTRQILNDGTAQGTVLVRVVVKDGAPVCVRNEDGGIGLKQAVVDVTQTPWVNITAQSGLLAGESVKDVYFAKKIRKIVQNNDGTYSIEERNRPTGVNVYNNPEMLDFMILHESNSEPYLADSNHPNFIPEETNFPEGTASDVIKRRVVYNINTNQIVYTTNSDGEYVLKSAVVDPSAETWVNITRETGLEENERVRDCWFRKTITVPTGVSDGELVETTFTVPTKENFYNDPKSLNFVVTKASVMSPKVKWQVLDDSFGSEVYGETTKRKIRNIGDVYDYILDFIDNEFTNHRPVNYIGAIKTRATPEGNDNTVSSQGISSEIIRVNGVEFELDDEGINSVYKKQYTPTPKNPYANIVEWGAVDIANLFTRTTNELSTCGLFYQGGILAGEEVDSMELAAHICGWICSLPISQDLTYQTIPALTAVDEEPFLGQYDAGRLLNEAGIQVIRPKSRLDKTFYVNNSIMPTGWHVNHVRCVTYLLKQLSFESGLGINNFVTNVEAYRAALETVAREVRDECELIREVTIGDVEVLSHYHIYVPISIVLSGVVTLINIGVSMALDETGTWGTYIKTTSGYSLDV